MVERDNASRWRFAVKRGVRIATVAGAMGNVLFASRSELWQRTLAIKERCISTTISILPFSLDGRLSRVVTNVMVTYYRGENVTR